MRSTTPRTDRVTTHAHRRSVSLLCVLLGALVLACGVSPPEPAETRELAGGSLVDIRKTLPREPLEVLVKTPVGRINTSQAINVIFNQPVVELTDLDAQKAKGFLTIAPPLVGEYHWIGTSTLSFTPTEGFMPATRYTVTIPEGVQGIGGGDGLATETRWSFETLRPTLMYGHPRQNTRWVEPNDPIRLMFNQPVELASVQKSLALFDDGVPLDFTVERIPEDADGEAFLTREGLKRTQVVAIMPAQPLPLASVIKIQLAPGVQSQLGPLADDRGHSLSFSTHGTFSVTEGKCGYRECGPNDSFSITLSNPLPEIKTPEDEANLAKYFTISPPAALRDTWSYWPRDNFNLRYDLKPSTTYTLTVKKGLPDKFGNALKQNARFVFKIGDHPSNIRIAAGSGVLDAPGVVKRIPGEARNVSEVQIRTASVAEANLIPTLHSDRYQQDWRQTLQATLGQPLKSQIQKLSGAKNRWSSFNVPLNSLPNSRGVIFYDVEVLESLNPDYRPSINGLLQMTDLGITSKLSPDETLVWVTGLDDAAPRADVTIRLRSYENELLWTGQTDAQGIARGPGLRDIQSGSSRNFYVTAEQGDELAYLSIEGDYKIAPWHFNLDYQWDWQAHQHEVQMFTDRGVYRAGDTVHFKGIVREEKKNQWAQSSDRTMQVWGKDSHGKTFFEETVTLSEFGTFSLSVPLPQATPLGGHRLFASFDDETKSDNRGTEGVHFFRVEAFRTPEFKVSATPTQRSYIAGERPEVKVEGAYLFGAPMNGADVRWNVTRGPAGYTPPGEWEGFSFINQEHEPSLSYAVEDREEKLDASGLLLGSFEVPAGSLTVPYRYTVDAEVSDLNRQAIASTTRVLIHPGDRYLGVGIEGHLVSAGQDLDARLVAVTPEGAPVAGVKGSLELNRVTWETVRERGPHGDWYYTSEEKIEVVATCEVTSTEAIATCPLSVEEPGRYFIRATGVDSKGANLSSTRSFYAYGSGWAPWSYRNDNTLELISDRDHYKPGDKATLLLKSPFKEATALITTERSGILHTELRELKGNAQTIEIDITDAHVPNLYVSVALVQRRTAPRDPSKREDPGAPAFRLGYVKLPVDIAARRLSVEVTPSAEEFLPGTEAQVQIKVKDSEGTGTQAEVALYAVDEGVLSLTGYQTPDPMSVFYRHRPLGVVMAESRLHFFQPISDSLKGGQSSGGGGEAESFRSVFSTTPYWNGQLVTDANGVATINVKLPENMTTFRVMAVANGRDARFGKGDAPLRVSKPLLVRPALPRFARVDDAFDAGFIVNNRTNAPQKVKATLSVDAQHIDLLETSSSRMVDVPANSGVEVRYKVRVRAPGAAAFSFSAKVEGPDASLQDGVRVELPMHAPTPVETVATNGVVEAPVLERILPPGGVEPAVGGLTLTMSSTALVDLNESLRYLVDYPYGCLEQTSSRTLALLSLKPLLDEFNLLDVDEVSLDDKIKAGLAKLTSLQAGYHGFMMWPTSRTTTIHGSIYAMHVLSFALEQGYEVPQPTLDAGQRFLTDIAQASDPSLKRRGVNINDRAYALYVLSRLGEGDHGTQTTLYRSRESLTLVGKAYLLLSIHASGGDKGQLDQIVEELNNSVAISSDGAYFGDPSSTSMGVIWRSDVRSTAVILYALLQAAPEHPLLPKITRWLLGARSNGRWSTTQENAMGALAMLKYMQTIERETPDMVARAFLGENLLAEKPFKGRSRSVETHTVPMSELNTDARDLIIAREGKGRLYYTVRLAYAPKEKRLPPREEGFTVLRRYESLETGEELTGFDAGQLVKVRLTIVAPQDRDQVALHDPLPAGLEPVNLDFHTTSARLAHQLHKSEANNNHAWYTRYAFDYVEKQDDAVNLFADHLYAGVYEYVYVARATSFGTFAAPPTLIEEMYSPEIFGRSSSTIVEVK